MNSSELSFHSHNLILADVANKSGDKEFKYDSPGHYMGLIQEALQELSFDTFFLEKEKVFDITEGCLKLTLPSGFFNIKQIFGYSGEDCNPQGKVNIYWKNNYKNKMARDSWANTGDPFHKNRGSNPPGNLFFCGIYNGIVELSENCSSLSKVVVRASGLITDVGETPVIPMFFRQAVTDYCVTEALSTRIANNVHMNKEVPFWQAIMNRHEARLRKPFTGSWDRAQERVKIMDSKTREDLVEYFSRLDY
tara:strand:- start:259 stop:1008 length:750 start_codon:yes stop_codon:yes gene_type:complete